MALLFLGFCAIQSRNEPMKRSIFWHICLSNCQVFWWRKWKRNWSENVYLYPQQLSKFTLYGLSQNWVNFDHFEISVKRKLYSKLISKNYFDYFSPHTYLSKNQKVIISWNRDFCNFKLKFSAKWHWKANHWSNINKWKGLVCWMIGLFWFFWFCIFKRCEL